ncbi:hypothetical protein GCM10007897_20860 [Sphingobium jiangsuense]|uniref:Ketosteroid isomerase-like protein n=1 Tax=Sphingobium jiangsuense TaxID=870476 RepID=A0A7W6BGF7_9SPHN|nr:DUF4440 domain-containing protein [Sphingobium jiangsuense]MBB3924392.1 ketosteroid isomerase-like protein [Sphingobium jiangsuense]GLT00697.1 hypothetical protein GCM10007897_20860 [Sphingobium jiangsuense]
MSANLGNALEAMNRAYGRNDVDAYFAFFSPEATIVLPGRGRVPVSAYVERWQAVVGSGAGVERCVMLDVALKPSPSGDASIVTYILDVTYRGMGVEGEDRRRLSMSEGWFLLDGAWKLVHMDWTTLEG